MMITNKILQCLLVFVLGSAQQPPARQEATPPPQPVEPFKVLANVYFVGPESEHSSFLITTPEGTFSSIADSRDRFR